MDSIGAKGENVQFNCNDDSRNIMQSITVKVQSYNNGYHVQICAKLALICIISCCQQGRLYRITMQQLEISPCYLTNSQHTISGNNKSQFLFGVNPPAGKYFQTGYSVGYIPTEGTGPRAVCIFPCEFE